MAIINGRILSIYDRSGKQVGISLKEIATVLGEPNVTDNKTNTTGDILNYLCNSSKINPAAKCKPINSPHLRPLSAEERVGTAADNANGVYYGLQCSSNKTILTDLHDANWAYVGKPAGGESSPCRTRDFDGYDHKAQFTLSGEGVPAEIYTTSKVAAFDVKLNWNVIGNTTGVDISEIFNLLSNNIEVDYSQLYLCVMIGGYMTAMYNSTVEAMTGSKYSPMYSNGRYCAEWMCPPLPQDFAAGDYKVTIVATVNDEAEPLRGTWSYVANNALYSGRYITIPELVGLNVKVAATYIPETFGEWGTGTIGKSPSGGLIVSFTLTTPPAQDSRYQVRLSYTKAGATAGGATRLTNKTFWMAAGSRLPQLLEWSADELKALSDGQNYQFTATLYGVRDDGNTILLATTISNIEWENDAN